MPLTVNKPPKRHDPNSTTPTATVNGHGGRTVIDHQSLRLGRKLDYVTKRPT